MNSKTQTPDSEVISFSIEQPTWRYVGCSVEEREINDKEWIRVLTTVPIIWILIPYLGLWKMNATFGLMLHVLKK